MSGLASLGTAIMALKGRVKGEAGSEKWIVTTLILIILIVEMIVLAWEECPDRTEGGGGHEKTHRIQPDDA
jgi:hypothetical protein